MLPRNAVSSAESDAKSMHSSSALCSSAQNASEIRFSRPGQIVATPKVQATALETARTASSGPSQRFIAISISSTTSISACCAVCTRV